MESATFVVAFNLTRVEGAGRYFSQCSNTGEMVAMGASCTPHDRSPAGSGQMRNSCAHFLMPNLPNAVRSLSDSIACQGFRNRLERGETAVVDVHGLKYYPCAWPYTETHADA